MNTNGEKAMEMGSTEHQQSELGVEKVTEETGKNQFVTKTF